MTSLPETVEVVVEVPRWGFVKRGCEGEQEFVSPVPCPFNYGSVVGHDGADGDPQDAVVLGPRLQVGSRVEVHVWGTVRFVDDGKQDDKWVCGSVRTSASQRRLIAGFFWLYARCKWVMNRVQGRRGTTRYLGMVCGTEGSRLG